MNLKKLKLKDKRYTVSFGESLFLRVYPTGIKSWVLRYNFKGQVKDITLGHYPELSLLQAKQEAKFKREELKIKPAIGITFNDAYSLWKSKKKGRIKSYHSECARIEKHLLPHLKKLQIDEVTAPIAINVLLRLNDKLPTLKRVLMRLNEILDLTVYAGLLKSNPCSKLSKLFATHTPIHHSYILAHDLKSLFASLNNEPLYMHIYVIFCVYTALRPHESTLVKWSYFKDFVLTMPAPIMKKNREHRVPITHDIYMILLLCKRIRLRRSTYIFNFGRANKPIHKQHLSRWLYRNGFKNRLSHHGLRTTFRTWLRDNNVPHEIAEDAIAHLSLTQTERAYLRIDYLEARKSIMQKWSKYILNEYCAVCANSPISEPILHAIKKNNS